MTSRRSFGARKLAGAMAWLDWGAEWLDHWSESVAQKLFWIGVYVTMPMLVVLVTLDVALRYAFNAPLQWGRDANGLLLLTTLFCALPHAWDRAYHIRMEVFYVRLSVTRRRGIDVLAAVTGVVVFGLMAVQAARFVPFMMGTGETGEDLDLPLWPFMGVLSFCAFVMTLRVFGNPAAMSDDDRGAEAVRKPVVSASDQGPRDIAL